MRRGTTRRTKKANTKRTLLWIASALVLAATVWYLIYASQLIKRTVRTEFRTRDDAGFRCIAWRRTRSCTPYGVRDIAGDKDCQAWISSQSGYCECEQGLTVKRVSCGRYRPFTCESACGLLATDTSGAEQLPANVTCTSTDNHEVGIMGVAAGWLQHRSSGSSKSLGSHAKATNRVLDAKASQLWSKVWEASSHAANAEFRLPESRTVNRDWVRDGVHIPRRDVLAIREQWQSFMSKSPSFPAEMFQGKGIVILAGGLTYMVPAWVNIHMLRRTGCNLPVEMFFPEKEYPTPPLEDALAELGVTSRQLPALSSTAQDDVAKNAERKEASLSGFTMKIAALILSQFQEVLFLDSDNVPVADPTSLFSSIDYQSTGALLWPDYWQSSAAADLAAVLDVAELPNETFESGQMVFEKQRTWKGLMLTAFFNMKSDLYYELFSNYMGKGDKESFAHALQAVGVPFSLVGTPVGTVGEVVQQCHHSGYCKSGFLGNTMTQFSTEGTVMFLHTNLSPKWNLEIPGDFSLYRRRWKVIQPGGADFIEEFGDLEQDVYHILVALRCAPFLPSYVEVMSSAGNMEGEVMSTGLKGFHPQNPGIDFIRAYRWGLSGPYLRFVEVTKLDQAVNYANTALKSSVLYIWRMLLSGTQLFTGRKQYFVFRP